MERTPARRGLDPATGSRQAPRATVGAPATDVFGPGIYARAPSRDASRGGPAVDATAKTGDEPRRGLTPLASPEEVQQKLKVFGPAEEMAAERYNKTRFHDPQSVKSVRTALGLPPDPPLMDVEVARAVAAKQAQFGFPVNGMLDGATTVLFSAELRQLGHVGEGAALRLDNLVSADVIDPPSYGENGYYRWLIRWNTTLRGGYIVQEVINTMNVTHHTKPTAMEAALGGAEKFPTPHYWEAWYVDLQGNITPVDHDAWTRVERPGTSGHWTMTGLVYTVRSLDPDAGFGKNVVPDASGDDKKTSLLSTVTQPKNLGPVLLRRTVGGTWKHSDNGKHGPLDPKQLEKETQETQKHPPKNPAQNPPKNP
jgi:hypothetical protein